MKAIPRSIALLLCLALGLPNPAWALRIQQSPLVRSGLEESLHPVPAGAEEILISLAEEGLGWIDRLTKEVAGERLLNPLEIDRSVRHIARGEAPGGWLPGARNHSWDLDLVYLVSWGAGKKSGQWVITFEPETWRLAALGENLRFSPRGRWSGTLVLRIPAQPDLNRSGLDRRLKIGLQTDPAGRLYLSSFGGSPYELAETLPSLLGVAALLLRPRVLADPADPLPFQTGWLQGVSDTVYDPLSGRIYLANQAGLYVLDGQGVFTSVWRMDPDETRPVRLQIDSQGNLYLLAVLGDHDVIYQLPAGAPVQPRVLVRETRTANKDTLFRDFVYDTAGDSLIVLTRQEVRFYDPRDGTLRWKVSHPLTDPILLSYDAQRKRLFITARDKQAEFEFGVFVCDAEEGTRLERWEDEISFPGTPWSMTFDPFRRKLFLVGSKGIREVDPDKHSDRDPIVEPLALPRRLVFSADTGGLFVLEQISIHLLGSLGRIRAFSAETGRPVPFAAPAPKPSPFVLHQPHGVFVGPFHSAALGQILQNLLATRQVDKILVGDQVVPTFPDPTATFIEVGLRLTRLRTDRNQSIRFERDGPVLHITPVPPEEAGGLEEIAKAIPGGQVLVVQASEISRRVGLEEFLARVPGGMAKMVLFGAGSSIGPELSLRNDVLYVDSDDPADLRAALAGMEENRVVFLGQREVGQYLKNTLPPSIQVSVLAPGSGLEEVLLTLGLPAGLLNRVNASMLEGQLARDRAA